MIHEGLASHLHSVVLVASKGSVTTDPEEGMTERILGRKPSSAYICNSHDSGKGGRDRETMNSSDERHSVHDTMQNTEKTMPIAQNPLHITESKIVWFKESRFLAPSER